MRTSFIVTTSLAALAFALLAVDVSIWIAMGATVFEYTAALSYFFLFFCGAIAGIISGYKIGLKNSFGKALFFLGIAQLLSMIAITWFDYARLREWSFYPSLGDLFYIGAAPCAAIGLAFIFRLHHMKFTRRSFGSIVVCITAAVALTLTFLGFPNIVDTNSWASLTDLFYVMSDALLLSVVFIIFYVARGKMYHGLHIYLTGIGAHFVANALFAYRVEITAYTSPADPAELMYIASAALLALGIAAMYKDFHKRVRAVHK